LKYHDEGLESGIIRGLKRHSRPGRRFYVKASAIPHVRNGFGVGILSTPEGVMTCREARKRSIGGEYLCSVY